MAKLEQTLQKRKYINKRENINLVAVRKLQMNGTIIIAFHAYQKSKKLKILKNSKYWLRFSH